MRCVTGYCILKMKQIEIYIDGASKGNPGPSGVGAVIYERGKVIRKISSFIGEATNNIAEYTAFIYALEEALKLKAEAVKVYTDSELMFRQVKKIYKIKNEGIRRLYNHAQHLMAAFKEIQIEHINRERNSIADELATFAVKQAKSGSLKIRAGGMMAHSSLF